ncbi:MAG: signal peptidase I [Coriobacteriia bacterium]|nr:signal peptidase I [Coriobacteriia bacterium]
MTDELQTTLGTDPVTPPAGEQAHQPSAHATDERPSFIRWVAELVLMVALAFLLATGIRTFIIQPYVIPSGSMIPTIELWDRVIANKFIYRFAEVEPGDIVVLDDPTDSVPTLIKRVVAVGGQTIDLVDGSVLIDGAALDEPYTHGKPSLPQTVTFPYVVPEDSVWVMGDNRTDSQDSRYFGAVPVAEVRGKAFFRFWPIDRIGSL